MQTQEPRLQVPEALADLPPSAKLTWSIVELEGPISREEVIDRSRLPTRTVADALKRLREDDVVERAVSLEDSRVRLYRTVE